MKIYSYLNIDLSDQTKISKSKTEFLHELCDTYDLYNLISESTYMTRTSESMIDLILTNCSRSLMHSKAIESGLIDFHKMTTTMRCTYTRQEPVKITYRDYTNFNQEKFISEFRAKKLKFKGYTLSTNTVYNNLTETLKEMLSAHATIKRRLIGGNQAPFMNKKLSRAIMTRTQLRNKYSKIKSTFDWITWKNQRNLCVKHRRQAIKDHYKLKCKNGTMNSKQFWKMLKPFISNKGNTDHNDIILIEEGKQNRDRKGVAEKLNNFFTDIIHITTGKTIISLEEGNHEQAILNIIAKYDNHISINNIGKRNIKTTFSFRMATTSDTDELISEINANKPMGTDLISPKILTKLKLNGFRGVLSRSS